MKIQSDSAHSENPFADAKASAAYDAWFETEKGKVLFARELACFKNLMRNFPGRWLEVGVGTGRFAEALRITDGVDPAAAMLALAVGRGINVIRAAGEQLPYPAQTFDGILMTTALCFFDDPAAVFKECRRVLKNSGLLVVGMIPADSPWGRLYARKARDGHALYSSAVFRTSAEVMSMAARGGWLFREACSCLLAPPDMFMKDETFKPGVVPDAGFVAMAFAPLS